jgi:hypothetical protein
MNRLLSLAVLVLIGYQFLPFFPSLEKVENQVFPGDKKAIQIKIPQIQSFTVLDTGKWRSPFNAINTSKKPRPRRLQKQVWRNPLESAKIKGLIPNKRATISFSNKTQSISIGDSLGSCILTSVQTRFANFHCPGQKVQVGWK